MSGSISPAASGTALASRPALGGAVSDIILSVTECQIAPGETACFPFAARTAYGIPSMHEFNVISDNPDFNPAWVLFRQSAGDSYGARYILEINPGDIRRSQYGAYPLRLSWRAAGTYRHAGGRCTLIVWPRVRAVTEPAVEIWPAGQVRLLLENRGSTGIDVSVSIRHSGSDWSKKWEFDLPAKDDPFSFSGRFNPPASKRDRDFELTVSAAGVPLVRRIVRARRPLIPRRLINDIQVGGTSHAVWAHGRVKPTGSRSV
jgi:hypothetical protein